MNNNAEVDVQRALRHIPRSLQESSKKLFNTCKSVRECMYSLLCNFMEFCATLSSRTYNRNISLQLGPIPATRPSRWLSVTLSITLRYESFDLEAIRVSFDP